jgi:hypothetical protein
MREEADNEKLLVRYLLGNLPEEQRLQVEGLFLGDDQQYEQLLALEDELFYDYAQGKLSPGERERFEERFLASGRNGKRVMLASAMAHKISQVIFQRSEDGHEVFTGDIGDHVAGLDLARRRNNQAAKRIQSIPGRANGSRRPPATASRRGARPR